MSDETDKLNTRVEGLEYLVNIEHDLKEGYKLMEQRAASRAFEASRFSAVWKNACKYWRKMAKREQKMVNERDVEIARLQAELFERTKNA